MKKKTAPIALFVILINALLLSACAARQAGYSTEESYALPAAPAMEMPAAVGVMDAQKSVYEGEAMGGFDASVAQAAERMVIKNASLSIVVDDPAVSMENITRMAEGMGGFVVSANLYQTQMASGVEVPHASLTVRVPAERLNEAMEKVRAESDRDPLNENVNSQDVTSEYTDLESRLRNLEAAEQQLTKIMEDALRIEDVLNVYNQLVSVREQIEMIKGQMKYYEQSAALSAISVDLTANAALQPLEIGGWQPVGVARDAVQALINGLQVLTDIAIWLVLFILPMVLVFVVIFFLPLRWMWRKLRGRGKAKAVKAPPAAQG
ncbi:MAG: DUF4349 domain-containing protein [Chloroflexi bacterium]|nr:DUF4349 domain-containing protein [Chloroflexota bacterium]